MAASPSHIARPTPKFTENCETKKRERRSPSSLIADVVARRSAPPMARIKRSRKDSYSSKTNTSTTSTIPVVSNGLPIEVSAPLIAFHGLAKTETSMALA